MKCKYIQNIQWFLWIQVPVCLMTASFQPAFQPAQPLRFCIYNCTIYKAVAHLAHMLFPTVTHIPLGLFLWRLVLKQRKEQNLWGRNAAFQKAPAILTAPCQKVKALIYILCSRKAFATGIAFKVKNSFDTWVKQESYWIIVFTQHLKNSLPRGIHSMLEEPQVLFPDICLQILYFYSRFF